MSPLTWPLFRGPTMEFQVALPRCYSTGDLQENTLTNHSASQPTEDEPSPAKMTIGNEKGVLQQSPITHACISWEVYELLMRNTRKNDTKTNLCLGINLDSHINRWDSSGLWETVFSPFFLWEFGCGVHVLYVCVYIYIQRCLCK